jgi:hypothetical protein
MDVGVQGVPGADLALHSVHGHARTVGKVGFYRSFLEGDLLSRTIPWPLEVLQTVDTERYSWQSAEGSTFVCQPYQPFDSFLGLLRCDGRAGL